MKRLTIAAIAAMLSLTSCASPRPADDPGSLASTQWIITVIDGSATLAAHQPTMRFDDETVTGSSGCNHYSGAFTQSGVQLSFSQIALSEMACTDSAVMAQETAFTTAIGKVARVSRTSSGLNLLDAGGAVQLELAAAPPAPSPRPLTQTRWRLTTVRTAQTAHSVVSGSSVTFTVTETRYSGKACNTFNGTATISGSAITLGPAVTTKMACKDADQASQEREVLDLLSRITTWKVTGEQLTLSTPDGSGLEFVTP